MHSTQRGDAPEDIWARYDPNAVDEALQETAGSWGDIDPDVLVAAYLLCPRRRNPSAVEALMPHIPDANWPVQAFAVHPICADTLRCLEPEAIG